MSQKDEVPLRVSNTPTEQFEVILLGKSTPSDSPKSGDQVTISYQATLNSGGISDGQIIENESEFKFVLGNGKAPECVEMAVR